MTNRNPIPSYRQSYRTYLASREWALKKRAVRQRSGGICERCQRAPATQVNHLSYEHLYDEPLDELQDVCRPCHEFLSAVSDYDPAAAQPDSPAASSDRIVWERLGDIDFYETIHEKQDFEVLRALFLWAQNHPGDHMLMIHIHRFETGETDSVHLPDVDGDALRETRRGWLGPNWRPSR